MSKYVVAFRGEPAGATSAADEQAWGAWFGQLGSTVTDRGNRVGASRTLPASHRGDPGTSVLRGYVVIEADNLDDAARLAAGCPGLAGAVDVEVAEVVPA